MIIPVSVPIMMIAEPILTIVFALFFMISSYYLCERETELDEAYAELRRMKAGEPMSDKRAKIIKRLELKDRIKKPD